MKQFVGFTIASLVVFALFAGRYLSAQGPRTNDATENDISAAEAGASAEREQPKQPEKKPRPVPDLPAVKIEGIPHVEQRPDFCGEACAEMFLRKLGYNIDQNDVFHVSGLDPVKGRGCYTAELVAALQNLGFRPGNVWFAVDTRRGEDASFDQMDALFASLHRDLQAGTPSIICMRTSMNPERATEHFRLIVGYDHDRDEVLYHEPATQRGGAYRRMPRTDFLDLWPLKYDENRWTVIRMRLLPGTIRQPGRTNERFSDADYAVHIHAVKSRLPKLEEGDWHFVLEKPFVVVGDEPPAVVERRSQGTVRWAVDHIKKIYFTKDPSDIITIYLFKDKDSYEDHAELLFGRKPHTPFGYYTHRHRALVMNISTGGGTLVHEIVHPFVASNFPECPSWFNEGLASLYEQCGTNNGQIWGYTNWRLAGLQKAITLSRTPVPEKPTAEGEEGQPGGAERTTASSASAGRARPGRNDRVAAAAAAAQPPAPTAEDGNRPKKMQRAPIPTFRQLCSTTTWQFYDRDPGTNYAQARYLCYYLQQRGLLRKYYHAFRENADTDPTGYKTLKSVLGIENEAGMQKFQKQWEDWILTLRYR